MNYHHSVMKMMKNYPHSVTNYHLLEVVNYCQMMVEGELMPMAEVSLVAVLQLVVEQPVEVELLLPLLNLLLY
jgi:hypothetical protein